MSTRTAKSTTTKTMNVQRLRHMMLGTDQHQPAPLPDWLSFNQVGASTSTAMPMSYVATVPNQQGYQSPYMAASPLPAGGQDQYTEFLALAAADLEKWGVRLDDSLLSREMIAGYKRKREEQSVFVHGVAHAKQQEQTIVVDRLLVNHASKMWEALEKQRQKHIRMVTSAAVDRETKRLKAKDEEITHIRGVNWVLQKRLEYAHMQAQMSRGYARSSEAAADVLRGDLQRVLGAHVIHGYGVRNDVDETSSCCWGDNQVELCRDNEYAVGKPKSLASVGRCKGCGQGEAIVLLLPCRHLCVCTPCATTTRACPACGSSKTGSINVNFS